MDSFVTAVPAPGLRPWIEGYIGYRIAGQSPGIHRGLPSRHLTFIVGIGDPINVVRQTNHKQAPESYRSVISGLQASHALIAHEGRQEGIAFELTPLGCRSLFGIPANEIWDTTLELEDVAGAHGGILWERLQGPSEWQERFEICDEELGRMLRPTPESRELQNAWSLLVGTSGTASVEWVAGQVGWSRQALTRRFRSEFGLSPKLAGRVIRFERARELLGGSDGPSIAEVAAACGYFDQAHMNRDFVELAGLSPGRLRVEEEVPSFQDGTLTPAA